VILSQNPPRRFPPLDYGLRRYSAKTLQRRAEAVRRWQSEPRDVFVYFDNDQKAAAPRDARRLLRMISE
jgi:uncharacterized protein YecE (DUF72 family)